MLVPQVVGLAPHLSLISVTLHASLNEQQDNDRIKCGILSIGLEPSQGSTVGPGGEDLITLEAEISELQRENARVESQMMRLRTDISAMEAHLRQGDKVSRERSQGRTEHNIVYF